MARDEQDDRQLRERLQEFQKNLKEAESSLNRAKRNRFPSKLAVRTAIVLEHQAAYDSIHAQLIICEIQLHCEHDYKADQEGSVGMFSETCKICGHRRWY